MGEPLHLLIIEDSAIDTALLLDELKEGGFDPSARRVQTATEMHEALHEENSWDVIISDYYLPQFGALPALNILKQSGLDIPFIVISGTVGEDTVAQVLKQGAHDYMMKDNLLRLVPAIKREIHEAAQRKAHQKTESALLEVQEAREALMLTLAHDLKTPILAEHHILEMLHQGNFGPVTQEQEKVLKELLDANQYITHLLDNMQRSYLYEEGQIVLNKEQTDTNELIRQEIDRTFAQAAQEKKLTLNINLQDALPLVTIDPYEMRRVIYNLLQNAMMFTPEGGTITVTTVQEEPHIKVCVEDTGIGMSGEKQKTLFERNNTLGSPYKHIGTGLGLYLSRKIVEAHQGQITVQSTPGKGSRFCFTIPVAANTPVIETGQTTQSSVPQEK